MITFRLRLDLRHPIYLIIFYIFLSCCNQEKFNRSQLTLLYEPKNVSQDTKKKKDIPLGNVYSYCQDSIYNKYLVQSYLEEFSINSEDRKKYSEQRQLSHLAHANAFKKLKVQKKSLLQEIPTGHHPRTIIWLRYYISKRGHMTFLKWLVRSTATNNIISDVLREEGVPKELFFLAMIESGFSSHAFSKARASGIWQFIKPTAKAYGLKINRWVDERRHLQKSTRAAARYIKDLNRKFNDWYLTLAAYNAGPGKISRAIRRAPNRGYWKLTNTRYLTKETKHYIPKLLAARELTLHAKDYGFTIYPIQPNELTSVSIDRQVNLYQIARSLKVTVKQLRGWNPELRGNVTPPKKHNQKYHYKLKIPLELESIFQDNFSR